MVRRTIENPILNSPFAEPTRHFRFDDGIEERIEPFAPGDGGVDQFDRLDLAASDQLGLRGSIEEHEVIGHGPSPANRHRPRRS
jgi:hypothetical protein